MHGVAGYSHGWGSVRDSYFNTDAYRSAGAGGRTAAQLRAPTDYAGIYANWNADIDRVSGGDDPWDFGDSIHYPLLKVDSDGDGTATWEEFSGQTQPSVAPTANAGPDLAGAPGESVTLQGTNSVNPYGAWWRMAHRWTQLSGSTVTLDHLTHGDPTFTIPDDAAGGATLEFELTVTDKKRRSDSDTMVVTVAGAEPANTPPTAAIDAAQVTAAVAGETVALQGVGNDAETATESLTFAWSQVGGTLSAPIAGASAATAAFTAPDVTEETELTFRLTVTDDGGLSASAETTIAVSPEPEPENTPPTAAIVAAQVATATAGETVALQGVGNDAETAAASLTFAWSQVGGTPSASIASASAATAAFTAPDVTERTELTFRLTVTDEGGLSASAETTIAVSPPPEPANTPPTAAIDAAQVTVAEAGETVALQGVGNDAETAAGSLTFAWSQVGGTPTVSIAGASAATAAFIAPDVTERTDLTFRLTPNPPKRVSIAAGAWVRDVSKWRCGYDVSAWVVLKVRGRDFGRQWRPTVAIWGEFDESAGNSGHPRSGPERSYGQDRLWCVRWSVVDTAVRPAEEWLAVWSVRDRTVFPRASAAGDAK